MDRGSVTNTSSDRNTRKIDDSIGRDDFLEDMFGMNICGFKTIWVLLTQPKLYFIAAKHQTGMPVIRDLPLLDGPDGSDRGEAKPRPNGECLGSGLIKSNM